MDSGEKIKCKLLSFDEFLFLSENNLFRNKDTIIELLKIRLEEGKKARFREQLFGKAN